MDILDVATIVAIGIIIYFAIKRREDYTQFPIGLSGSDVEAKLWINERLIRIVQFFRFSKFITDHFEKKSRMYYDFLSKFPVHKVEKQDKVFVNVLRGIGLFLVAIIIFFVIAMSIVDYFR